LKNQDINIYLSRPDITDMEIDAVRSVLMSNDLSSGPRVAEFEKEFAQYIGRKHAIAVNSGTSALFLCVKSLGIGPGDEVITTPFTFIASTNCILMAGATPVFVDIDSESLNIDPAGIEEKINDNTKAILHVAIFGNPVGLDKVRDIAGDHKLSVIEDSCEALGSSLRGRKAGNFGTLSTFAFYPNKQITTGEGGMIVTDDDKLADICRSLRNQGQENTNGELVYERVGFNFRLSDINSVIGLVQLVRLPENIKKRQKVAQWYKDILKDETRLKTISVSKGCDLSWFLFVVQLSEKYSQGDRDKVMDLMLDAGIQIGDYFAPVHLQPHIARDFGYREGDFPITEKVSKSTLALPFHGNLTKEKVEVVCENLKRFLDKIDSQQVS